MNTRIWKLASDLAVSSEAGLLRELKTWLKRMIVFGTLDIFFRTFRCGSIISEFTQCKCDRIIGDEANVRNFNFSRLVWAIHLPLAASS